MIRLLNFVLAVVLALGAFDVVAFGETVASEEWKRVEYSVSIENFEFKVNADIMVLPETEVGQEYRLLSLNSKDTHEIAKRIPWASFGFEVDDLQWEQDGAMLFTMFLGKGEDRVFLNTINSGSFARRGESAAYLCSGKAISSNAPYEMMYYDVSSVPKDWLNTADTKAAALAEILGYQIGMPVRIKYWDQEAIKEHREALIYYNAEVYSLEEYIPCIEIYYPVYVNGLRFYSGSSFPMAGDSSPMPCAIGLTVSEQGLEDMEFPIIQQLKPQGKPKKLITGEDALKRLQEYYSNLYLPGMERVEIRKGTCEYLPTWVKADTKKGNMVYPIWWFHVVYEQSGTIHNTIRGVHALDGKILF